MLKNNRLRGCFGLLIELLIAKVKPDIGGHHHKVQTIEEKDVRDLGSQKLGGDPKGIPGQDHEQKEKALAFGGSGPIRF
jgi:hypothetical protein